MGTITAPPPSTPLLEGTQVEELPAAVTETQLATPWQVLVHDDPITLMSYVTLTLQKIFGYSLPKAERLMLTVHKTGKAVVWAGDKEHAELYAQKLHSWMLKATIVRAPC